MHVTEGQLVCPNCSHVFPIRNGIPNMVSDREEERQHGVACACASFLSDTQPSPFPARPFTAPRRARDSALTALLHDLTSSVLVKLTPTLKSMADRPT